MTVDVDSFRELPDAVTQVLGFQPDRERTLRFLGAAMRACRPGKPQLVVARRPTRSSSPARLDAATADLGARRPLVSA